MITLQQFLDKYLGQSKGYPTDTQYKGECLSIVKLYILECFGINPPPSGSGSAYGYWSNFPNPLGEKFEKILNTDDLIPEKGWIAIWQPWSANQYGHISIVADGSTTGTLKNYAQNWTSRIFQLESNRYTNIVGFLKPKNDIISSEMTEEQKRILDFLGDKTEGQVREAFGALQDLPTKNEQIINLTNKVHDLELKIIEISQLVDEIKTNFIEKEKEIVKLQKTIESANTNLNEQILKNEELDRLAKDNRNLYLQKNDEFNAYKLSEKETIKSEIVKELNIGDLFTLLVNKILKK